MTAYLWEWGSLLLRWLHITAAMAWIGSSFFFMHLDASLRKSANAPDSQSAVAWQVHGGGFYEMQKYFVAPDHLDPHLTWHKWQAYTTWLSGFILLTWIYYAQTSLYLIDPSVRDIDPLTATFGGIGALAVGWIVYDAVCRSPFGRHEGVLALVELGLVTAACYGFANVFSSRGALIHTGALMATWMAGNVFLVIIPNQKKVVASLLARTPPDPALGKQAKQRSAQNNYLTLPVVLLMMSSHYPVLYADAHYLPIIVAFLTTAGALVRYFYNVRHANHSRTPWWAWFAAALLVACAIGVAVARSPVREFLTVSDAAPARHDTHSITAPSDDIVNLVASRCAMCHADIPSWDGIVLAPKGVHLDSAAAVGRQAAAIRHQVVETRNMPPNNLTAMTDEERSIIAAWTKPGSR